jgi:hypothetical protein
MSKRQRAERTCPNCGEPILWATQSKGGRLPLNLAPQLVTGLNSGPFYLLNDFEMICTRADVGVIELAIENGDELFTNHVVTCEKRERSAA